MMAPPRRPLERRQISNKIPESARLALNDVVYEVNRAARSAWGRRRGKLSQKDVASILLLAYGRWAEADVAHFTAALTEADVEARAEWDDPDGLVKAFADVPLEAHDLFESLIQRVRRAPRRWPGQPRLTRGVALAAIYLHAKRWLERDPDAAMGWLEQSYRRLQELIATAEREARDRAVPPPSAVPPGVSEAGPAVGSHPAVPPASAVPGRAGPAPVRAQAAPVPPREAPARRRRG